MNELVIRIHRASNGFVVESDGQRFATQADNAVAHTPQELAAIVEAWAKGPPVLVPEGAPNRPGDITWGVR